ncbi:hypothetical protein ACFXTI_014243 [Malus domestica]
MIHQKNQLLLIAQGNIEGVDVGLDKEVGEAFVLQEAEAKAAKQSIRHGGDISKLLRDSEGEVKFLVETWATRRTRATVVESSEFEPEKRP